MRAAMSLLQAKLAAGRWPTSQEVGAMLVEADVPANEVRDLARRYEAHLPGEPPSGEIGILAALREFTGGPPYRIASSS